jgi:hypothetical protein
MPKVKSYVAAITDEATGLIYIYGGWNGAKVSNTVWEYNPISDTWHQLPSMLYPQRDLETSVSLLMVHYTRRAVLVLALICGIIVFLQMWCRAGYYRDKIS